MTNFSVLISIYHKENPVWFREALDCIFKQTIQPSEIVLVDDGPLTPELYAIIDQYSKKYPIFNIVKNEQNLGLGLALRKGVLAAKYDILARMDTDDIIPPHRFATQLKHIEEGYDVVSCWSTLFLNEKDNVIAVKTRPEKHNEIVELAHKRSPICHAAAFMRKSAVLAAGNYLHKQYYEDYNLWVRMIMNGSKFFNVQESLYFVRTTEALLDRRSGFSYLKNEVRYLKEFYDMGFYSLGDLIKNSLIRIATRLTPKCMRKFAFKIVWNSNSKNSNNEK